MPNHCMNEVTLKCRTDEIARAIKAHLAGKDSLFDFNSLMPEPRELLESTDDPETKAARIAEFGHDGWYGWRLANWGTKWNSCDCSLDDSMILNGELLYCFDTAWSPPEGIYKRLMEYIETNQLAVEVSWYANEPVEGNSGYLEDA